MILPIVRLETSRFVSPGVIPASSLVGFDSQEDCLAVTRYPIGGQSAWYDVVWLGD